MKLFTVVLRHKRRRGKGLAINRVNFMKLCHHSLDNFFKKNEVAGAEDELEDF